MNFNSKIGEEEFSTNQGYHELKGYSSRHRKIKQRNHSIVDFLPHKMQKAAITIQKFWRARLSTRRLFYEQMLEQLLYDNQITALKNKKQKQYIEAIERDNTFYEQLNRVKVSKKFGKSENQTKQIIKKCIGLTFRFQKKMLTKQEIEKLLIQRQDLKTKINQLKEQKNSLRKSMSQEYQQDEQILLRQIRQANTTLLKVATEKNLLKQKYTQKMLRYNSQFQQI